MYSLLFFFSPLSLWLFRGISSLVSCVTVTAQVLAEERCQERVARSSFFSLSLQSGQNHLKKNSLRRTSTGLQSKWLHVLIPQVCGQMSGMGSESCTLTTGDASSCYLNGAWELIQKPSPEHISFSKIAPRRWSSTFFLSISFLKNIKHWEKRVCKMRV